MAKSGYHHGDLRTALLDAAEALVREKGTEGWSLREASARTGVSPSAAYHHFGARGELVSALSGRVLTRLAEQLHADVAAAPADDELAPFVAISRGYVRWAVTDPAVARLAFGARHAQTSVSPHPHDLLARELDRLTEKGFLSAGARRGAEFVVWAAIHGLATLLVDGLLRLDGEAEVDLEAERLIRAVLTGLSQERPDGPVWPAGRSAHTERQAEAGGEVARSVVTAHDGQRRSG